MRNMKAKGTKLTKEEYDLIKQLRGMGVKQHEVARITKRGDATVNRIARSETYEDYRDSFAKAKEAKYVVKQPEPSDEQVTVNDARVSPIPPPALRLDDQPNQLDRIAKALERLADAWEAKPITKRGLFK